MNSLLDHLLVGALLVASLCYAFWALGPKLLRARLLLALGRSFERHAGLPGFGALGRRFRAAAERKQPGCGGCDSCGPAPAAGPEVRIPVGKIGRRV